MNHPYFSPDSFWNQPLPSSPTPAARNRDYQSLLAGLNPLHINIHNWTIPVYYADTDTPRYRLRAKLPDCPLSQGHRIASEPWLHAEHPRGIHASAQGKVPIPDAAAPDGENDAHLSIIDLDARRVYDLWQARRDADSGWSSNAAIAYDLDGPGIFSPDDFSQVHNRESIHYYGPCRASGVPNIAGLILRDEIRAGRIAHKLAFACPVPGLEEFCTPPAIWTDGWRPGGIPEGIVLQLSPDLTLDTLGLSPAAMTVARALQEFGAVLVDYAGAFTLYAQGETGEPGCGQPEICWNGVLEENDLQRLPQEAFRFLAPAGILQKGSHPVYHCGMSKLFYDYLAEHGVPQTAPDHNTSTS